MSESWEETKARIYKFIGRKEKKEDKTPRITPKPQLKARMYNVTKIERGVRKVIAFGLNIREAETIARETKKALWETRGPNSVAGVEFEITEVKVDVATDSDKEV